MLAGAVLTAILVFIFFLFIMNLLQLTDSKTTITSVAAALAAAGTVIFCIQFLKTNGLSTEERYAMHRSHANSWAFISGIIVMTVWILYDYAVHELIRSDFLFILLVMILAKGTALFIYSRKH